MSTAPIIAALLELLVTVVLIILITSAVHFVDSKIGVTKKQ